MLSTLQHIICVGASLWGGCASLNAMYCIACRAQQREISGVRWFFLLKLPFGFSMMPSLTAYGAYGAVCCGETRRRYTLQFQTLQMPH